MLLVVILLIAMAAHGFNMFNFPFYENDEGTYMSRAWSLVASGQLSPYTYTYDIAPVGWMFIALWSKISGGFFTFGFSINSGRVLMLWVHLFSVGFLFYIARRLTDSIIIATAAALIFSLSPLAIYFHRRVLIENIMVLWLLASLAFLLKPGKRLSMVMLSGFIYSLALVTREVAIVFLPAYLFVLFSEAHRSNRAFFIGLWLTTALWLPLFYILYSLIQREFFPAYSLLGGSYPHVSLLETTMQQLSTSFTLRTNLGEMLREWARSDSVGIQSDPLLILSGVISGAIAGMHGLSKPRIFYPFLMSITYWIFLVMVDDPSGHHIVPLIPFLVLNIAAAMSWMFSTFTDKDSESMFMEQAIAGLILVPFVIVWYSSSELYSSDLTSRQEEAVDWLRENAQADSIIVTDNYAYLDLRVPAENDQLVFPNTVYYWVVDLDPEIRDGLLSNDWRQVDYVLSTPQSQFDAQTYNLDLVYQAQENSRLRIQYTNEGWPVEVREVEQNPGQN